MKKILVVFIFTLLFFPVTIFAQTAKIIDIEGEVLVKKEASLEWQKAKIDMLLDKQSEVKTQEDSYCTLAFDEELRNILIIKENSHIKIEEVKPGNIFLPEGRVFTLIENLSKHEQFQIRTPTAIAGARGTGWITAFFDNKASVFCFVDTVYIQGLDNSGKITGEMDLPSDNGLDIGDGGLFGEMFSLTDANYEEWSDFMDYEGDLREGDEEEVLDGGSLEDLRQEQREDQGQIGQEIRHNDEESRQQQQQQQRVQ